MTANPARGVRLERNGSLQMTNAGRFALPSTVSHNGTVLGTGRLILTHEHAAELHTGLGRLLAEIVPPPTPDERSETT